MSEFRVLLTDGIDPAGVDVMRRTGAIEPIVEAKIAREKLLELVRDLDGIVVRSATQVDRELIGAAGRLKVIGRAGVGVDNVDLDAATERGIIVMNSPGGSTTTTAEHAVAMMFALSRNIPQAYRLLREGTWDKNRFKGVELRGKVLGVVGLGRIGSEVARMGRGIGMKVLAYDPFISPSAEQAGGLQLVGIEEILAEADFITVHTPLTEETRDLIDASAISKMKDGVRLINCARGGIINELDLVEALRTGKVAGAAFDVFESEPNTESPLFDFENFVATPHLGASTVEAQRKVSEDICRQIVDYLTKDTIRGALNFPQLDAAELDRYKHFVDLGTRLASFVGQISEGPIESISIRYSGEVCEMNLGYLTSTVVWKLLAPILKEGVNLVNATRVAQQRGIKLEETRVPVPENFTSLVEIVLRTKEEERRVSGTVFTDKVSRIVAVDGYRLEVIPRGDILFLTNNDKPGVIGSIGTVLGQCHVNIAGMHLGREAQGGIALALLLVDQTVDEEVLDQLRHTENVLSAKAVRI
jgi:D-3-phosphoglycerate dehydrogenase